MADGKSISDSLKRLNRLYQKIRDPEVNLYCAKIAVIELCGWTEQTIDRMSLDLAKICLSSNRERTDYEKKVVEKTFGFEYEKHFKEMFVQIIGRKGFSEMEDYLDTKYPQVFQNFKSSIGALKPIRNQAAHTSIHQVSPSNKPANSIAAPSSTLRHFENIRIGLFLIEKELKKRYVEFKSVEDEYFEYWD